MYLKNKDIFSDTPPKSEKFTSRGPRRGRVHRPDENQAFAIAELKRLSGLPDDFKLSGTFVQKAERIGRMVPPLMTNPSYSARG